MAVKGEMYIIFNFFEQIKKPPEMESYLEGMKYIYVNYVGSDFAKSFVIGHIHKNIDPNGMYKYVNFVTFNNDDFHPFKKIPKPPPKFMEVHMKALGGPGCQTDYPGAYAEVAKTSAEPMCTRRAKDENSIFLLINFKDTDVVEASHSAFEADWKTKSGADIITSEFPSIGDIALYKRRQPGRTPFIYVLRCEVLPGSSVDDALKALPAVREKLTEGKVPFSDAAAYNIAYIHPEK